MLIATEDAVSEAVARKLIASVRPDLAITVALDRQGNGYLRSRARELNRVGRSMPVLILADLDDRSICVPDIMMSWFGTRTPHLMFRVAVLEIESWILADRSETASLLGVPQHRIPEDTDGIADPKQFLVNLARRSRSSSTRQDLAPAHGSTALVGPAYVPRISGFVERTWDPSRASTGSESLRRAIARIRACKSPPAN